MLWLYRNITYLAGAYLTSLPFNVYNPGFHAPFASCYQVYIPSSALAMIYFTIYFSTSFPLSFSWLEKREMRAINQSALFMRSG